MYTLEEKRAAWAYCLEQDLQEVENRLSMDPEELKQKFDRERAEALSDNRDRFESLFS